MSSRRASMSSPSQSPGSADPSRELKPRVISCLNRLSDRDTMASATNELKFIVNSLTPDSFSTFISTVHGTDASEKSLVRRQCVRMIGLLAEKHGDDVAPFIPKMVGVVVRRLKDCDSAVRLACVETVSALAKSVTKVKFTALFKPLFEVVSVELDYNLQIGAAMCLGKVVEEVREGDDVAVLSRAVGKMVRLVRSECFKAKPALLGLIGSVVGAGGGSGKGVMDGVVECAVEFLSSEDWAARKAAVEVLEKVVSGDVEAVMEYRKTVAATLESRRFDKVTKMFNFWVECC